MYILKHFIQSMYLFTYFSPSLLVHSERNLRGNEVMGGDCFPQYIDLESPLVLNWPWDSGYILRFQVLPSIPEAFLLRADCCSKASLALACCCRTFSPTSLLSHLFPFPTEALLLHPLSSGTPNPVGPLITPLSCFSLGSG